MASPRAVVEIGAIAEGIVNPLLTRRLIDLELGDIVVPPPAPKTGSTSAALSSALFYRVLAVSPGLIRVELWERGEFLGARTVNVKRGTTRVHARGIALAAAELARGLRAARLIEATEAKLPSDRHTADRKLQRPGLSLDSGLIGAVLGQREAGLVGPTLAGRLRLGAGAELSLGTAWLFGAAPDLSSDVRFVWRELSITPAYLFALSRAVSFGVGASFAVAGVHVTSAEFGDEGSREQDTWSARTTLQLPLAVQLSRSAELVLRPELGATLRRLDVRELGPSSDAEQLGGLWLGLALQASFGGGRE